MKNSVYLRLSSFLFTFFFLLFLLLLSSTLPFLCFLSLGVNSTRFVSIKNQDYKL